MTITRLIADGGMGRVYEGIQGKPSRTVAIKVVRPGLLSPASMRRFEYESAVLARLSHPGIARIYSAGMQRVRGCDLPYFVMEYVEEGRPVTAHATERNLTAHGRRPRRSARARECERATAEQGQRSRSADAVRDGRGPGPVEDQRPVVEEVRREPSR